MSTDREQLIAKARAAIKPSDSIELVRAFEHLASENALGEATSTPSAGEHFHIWSDVPCKPGQCRMEAHTPTDDEREALAVCIAVADGARGSIPTAEDYAQAERVLAAGFRRTVQGKPGEHGGTIPLYGMLDVWMALYGTSHPEFDAFYAGHGYAETWARIIAAVRERRTVQGEPMSGEAKAQLIEAAMDEIMTDPKRGAWLVLRDLAAECRAGTDDIDIAVQGEPSDAQVRDRVVDALVMTRLSDFSGTDLSAIEQAADAVLNALRAAGVVSVQGEPSPVPDCNGHQWMSWSESGKNGTYCRRCEGWAGKAANTRCPVAVQGEPEGAEVAYFTSLDGDYAEESSSLAQAGHVRREASGAIPISERTITKRVTYWVPVQAPEGEEAGRG